MAPTSAFVKYYMSNPSDKLGGRPTPVAVPSVLGGGGSVNVMTYARGLEEDFEDWAWPKEELVELLKKVSFHLCSVWVALEVKVHLSPEGSIFWIGILDELY